MKIYIQDTWQGCIFVVALNEEIARAFMKNKHPDVYMANGMVQEHEMKYGFSYAVAIG